MGSLAFTFVNIWVQTYQLGAGHLCIFVRRILLTYTLEEFYEQKYKDAQPPADRFVLKCLQK